LDGVAISATKREAGLNPALCPQLYAWSQNTRKPLGKSWEGSVLVLSCKSVDLPSCRSSCDREQSYKRGDTLVTT